MYIKKAEILALDNKTVTQDTINKLVTHKCVDGMSYIQDGKITITMITGEKIEVTVSN